MIKKLLTTTLLLILFLLIAPFAQAQRGIDPSLQPENAPGTPKTGMSQDDCYTKYKDSVLGFKYDEKTDEYKILNKDDLLKEIWDEASGLCLGESAAEPINAFLQILGGALLMISGGLAVIVMAVGGFMYITSRANSQQMEYAKNTLVYGVLGMLVVIFSYFIVSYVIELVIGASGGK